MKKILVVEDDRDQGMALAIRLRKAGYQVSLAEDAIQGFAQARANPPDLIILDLGLPAGGGYALLENTRHIMSAAMIPIIVLTARDPAQHRDRVMQLGAAVYFQKPADNDELLAAIERLTAADEVAPAGVPPPSRVKREQTRQWREQVRREPDNAVMINDLAWILATARDPVLRDVGEAARLGERLLAVVAPPGTPPNSYRKDRPELVMAMLDTLAAIKAAEGKYAEAVRLVGDGLAIARQLGQAEAECEMTGRLRIYERSLPLLIDYE